MVVFGVDGASTRTVTFTEKPIGMDFNRELPVKITNVTGHAEALGVKVGWQVKMFGGVDFEDPAMTFAVAFDVFKEKLAAQPMHVEPAQPEPAQPMHAQPAQPEPELGTT